MQKEEAMAVTWADGLKGFKSGTLTYFQPLVTDQL